jgi:hypothetical protein
MKHPDDIDQNSSASIAEDMPDKSPPATSYLQI